MTLIVSSQSTAEGGSLETASFTSRGDLVSFIGMFENSYYCCSVDGYITKATPPQNPPDDYTPWFNSFDEVGIRASTSDIIGFSTAYNKRGTDEFVAVTANSFALIDAVDQSIVQEFMNPPNLTNLGMIPDVGAIGDRGFLLVCLNSDDNSMVLCFPDWNGSEFIYLEQLSFGSDYTQFKHVQYSPSLPFFPYAEGGGFSFPCLYNSISGKWELYVYVYLGLYTNDLVLLGEFDDQITHIFQDSDPISSYSYYLLSDSSGSIMFLQYGFPVQNFLSVSDKNILGLIYSEDKAICLRGIDDGFGNIELFVATLNLVLSESEAVLTVDSYVFSDNIPTGGVLDFDSTESVSIFSAEPYNFQPTVAPPAPIVFPLAFISTGGAVE